MEIISFLALILLSLVGYSAGAAVSSGKFEELKPQVIDLVLVVLIWAGGIYSRIVLHLNKWILILIFVALSFVVASITVRLHYFTKRVSRQSKSSAEPAEKSANLWQRWRRFSYRIGSFQSRIILSLFFFIFISPIAIAVKIFSDPLKIRREGTESHWLSKKDIKMEFDQYRRQF